MHASYLLCARVHLGQRSTLLAGIKHGPLRMLLEALGLAHVVGGLVVVHVGGGVVEAGHDAACIE